MEYLMTPLAGGLRAASRLALVLTVVTLSAGNAAAQTAPDNSSSSSNPVANALSAFTAPAAPAPVYNSSGPVFIDSKKILESQQTAQLPAAQAIAPPEMLTAELVSLSRRVGACQSDPGCSVRNRLKIMEDESNAMHEALARMDAVCSILSYNSCLYPQYTELQQWNTMNDQMRTMMESVQTAAATGGENAMVMSQNTDSADQLNNMAPAAGNTAVENSACTMGADTSITCPGTK